MSASDWKSIYRDYSGEELSTEIQSLKRSLAGGFTSQGSGSVSHTRDTSELRDRLKAASEVKREKSGNGASRVATADFSGIRTDQL